MLVVGISISYNVSIFGRTQTAEATGSGVIITKDGYILTNNHVVSSSDSSYYYEVSEATSVTVSLYGRIDSKKGTIYLTGQQIASKKLKGFDVLGKLYKQDYKWFADISTKDKKIDLNAFYETKRNNGIVVSYNGVDSNNVLQILGFKNPQLSGKVSGNIKYSANMTFESAKIFQ